MFDSYWGTRRHPLRRRIAQVVADMQPESVLEVGCGAGAVLAALREELPHARLSGVDRLAEAVLYADQHVDAAVSIGDHHGPFDPHDVVVTCGLLVCLPPEALDDALGALIAAADSGLVLAEGGPPAAQEGDYWRRDYVRELERHGVEATAHTLPRDETHGHMDTITVARW
jgi:trans-aconitate methyltransferase